MPHLLYLTQEFDLEQAYGALEITWTDDWGTHTLNTATSTWTNLYDARIYRHHGAAADTLTHPSGIGGAVFNVQHPCFGDALGAAMRAVSPSLDVTVTFIETDNRYRIDVQNSAVFTATFSSAEEVRMQKLLGLAGNITAPGVGTAGTLAPYFTIEPAKQAIVGWTDARAMDQQSTVRYTASGDVRRFGPVRPTCVARFELAHETDAKTLSEFAGTGYCWQQFWNDAGENGRMCYLVDSAPAVGQGMRWAFRLRTPEFDESTHRREVASLRDRWRITFDVLLRGRW